MTQKSNEALQALQALWQREGDGPIVTMDAGPNIHLLIDLIRLTWHSNLNRIIW